MAIPCFLASFHSTLPLIESLLPAEVLSLESAADEAENLWTLPGSDSPLNIPPTPVKGGQKEWDVPKVQAIVTNLRTQTTTPEDKARTLAVLEPEVGAWLAARPSPQLGTHLSNETFRISCALRLGCDICQPHKCPCGETVSTLGYHGLACKRSAGRIARHSNANDVLIRALRSAEVPSIKEPPGCSREDGKRPDGMTIIPWSRGKSLVWDYTCRDTFAPSYVLKTSSSPGAAARMAEEEKKKKYDFLTDRFVFVPVAMETTGIFGQEGLQFIRQIGQRITAITGEERATSFLIQRLSIATQRGNVASILGTLPPGKELEEIFLL
jgi:hypothetical protein